MIQGSEQQRGVERVVWLGERSRIADLCRYPTAELHFGDREVSWGEIHQVNLVAIFGEPARVHAGAAADVHHLRWRGGKEAPKNLLCANQFELTEALGQSILFADALVVLNDLFGLVHRPTVEHTR